MSDIIRLENKIDSLTEAMVKGFDRIETEMHIVKADVHSVKSDMHNVKSDMHIVKADIILIKDDLGTVKDQLEKVTFNTNGLDKRVSALEDKMRMVGTKLGLA
jgi:archaellum component FlaC